MHEVKTECARSENETSIEGGVEMARWSGSVRGRWLVVAPPPSPKKREKRNVLIVSAQMLEVTLLGVGTVLRLERDAWSMAK